jgi:hypothetical protein
MWKHTLLARRVAETKNLCGSKKKKRFGVSDFETFPTFPFSQEQTHAHTCLLFFNPPRHPTPIGQVMTSPRICNAFCPIRQLSELRRHQYNHPKRGSEVVAQANSEVRFVCLVFTLSRSRTCCSLGFI